MKRALPYPRRFGAIRAIRWGALTALGLRLTGWMAVNLLGALGVLALIAWMIGNFSLPGTMHQLANLTGRYVLADEARQAAFDSKLSTTFIIAALVIALLRRGSAAAAIAKARGDRL